MNRTAAKRLLRRHAGLVAIVSFVLTIAGPARAATLSLVVLTGDGRPLSGAVVTAEPQGIRMPAPAPTKTIVDQVDLAFVPDLTVIPVGSSVSFPNSDAVSHQVYSFSPARKFQLPLYRGKQHAPIVFDQPGIVTLGCNIHDNMLAYVVVTAAPFFGRTDAKGVWVVPNAPEGTYRVRVWHPRLKDQSMSLERLSVGSSEITLKLDQTLRPAPLKGHPHSWDY
jgi:plastocyanin